MKDSPSDTHGGGMPIRCDKFSRGLTIEVGDKAGEVLGQDHECKYSDQMAVVRGGEYLFEVKIAEDDVLLVGVSIFYTEA